MNKQFFADREEKEEVAVVFFDALCKQLRFAFLIWCRGNDVVPTNVFT